MCCYCKDFVFVGLVFINGVEMESFDVFVDIVGLVLDVDGECWVYYV